METAIKTPVLIRDGRRFVDEETIMQLISDVDPVLAVTLTRYIAQWAWEKVVPIEGAANEGADDPGDSDCLHCGGGRYR